MRRLAISMGALAFLWACGATAYLLFASSEAGMAASAILPAGESESRRIMPPLASATGVWMSGLLMCITMLTGIPLGLSLTLPSDQRTPAWCAGFLILGFCALSGVPVGLPYLPSAVLLLVAGAVGRAAEPRDMPLPDFGG